MDVFKALMFAHLPLAVIEAFIAAGLYALLTGELRQPSLRFSVAAAVAVLVIAAFLLFVFPGASELPDGLEWTIEQCNLMSSL